MPNVITGDVIRTDTYRWSADKTECSERQQYCCCLRTGLDEIYCLVRQHICDILRTLYTIYLPTNPYTYIYTTIYTTGYNGIYLCECTVCPIQSGLVNRSLQSAAISLIAAEAASGGRRLAMHLCGGIEIK